MLFNRFGHGGGEKRPPIFNIALKNYLKSFPTDLGLGTENPRSQSV